MADEIVGQQINSKGRLTMNLTIGCAVDSADALAVYDTAGGRLCFESEDCGLVTMISVDQESATKLRDALTDWLEGQV